MSSLETTSPGTYIGGFGGPVASASTGVFRGRGGASPARCALHVPGSCLRACRTCAHARFERKAVVARCGVAPLGGFGRAHARCIRTSQRRRGPVASGVPRAARVKRLGTEDTGTGRGELAPATIGVLHSIVSSVMKSAVRDRRLASNPCAGTRLPKLKKRKVVPPTTDQVAKLTPAMPGELRALVTFAAGTGMRQGECLGPHRRPAEHAAPRGDGRPAADHAGRVPAAPGASQDAGERSDHPAPPCRRRRACGPPCGGPHPTRWAP